LEAAPAAGGAEAIGGGNIGSANQTSVTTSSEEAGESIPASETEDSFPRVVGRWSAWRAEEDAIIRGGVEAGESWEALGKKLSGRDGAMERRRAC
jgi:hypothetical protein